MTKVSPEEKRGDEASAESVYGDSQLVGEPWMPLPGETAREYFCFKAFLDMGPGRSLKTLTEVSRVPIKLLRTLHETREWSRRLEGWHRHTVSLEFASRERTIEAAGVDWEDRRAKIREAAYAVSQKLLEKARDMLQFPLEEEVETTEERTEEDGTVVHITNIVRSPVKWSLRDAATFIEVADKTSRLAADMSTANVSMNVKSRKVELTTKMLVQLMTSGSELAAAKQRLLGVGMDPLDVEEAAKELESKNLVPRKVVEVIASEAVPADDVEAAGEAD